MFVNLIPHGVQVWDHFFYKKYVPRNWMKCPDMQSKVMFANIYAIGMGSISRKDFEKFLWNIQISIESNVCQSPPPGG